MNRNIYFCRKETYYAGKHYWPEECWDEDVSDPPPVGDYWALRSLHEPDTPVDLVAKKSIVTSSSRGRVQWAPQPGREQPAAPPTPEELEEDRTDPYGLKRQAERQPVPVSSKDESGHMTPEEIQKSIDRQEAARADFEKDHATYVGDEPPESVALKDEPAGAESSAPPVLGLFFA